MNKSFGTPEQFRAAVENRIDELETDVVSSSATSSYAPNTIEGAENLSIRDAKNRKAEEEIIDCGCVTC